MTGATARRGRMADIKQAAKWLDKSESVARPEFHARGFYTTDSRKGIFFVDRHSSRGERRLTPKDLLADDWEIAS